jgi:hypothetical protein
LFSYSDLEVRNPKHKIPGFAEAATRKQAKSETSSKELLFGTLEFAVKIASSPPAERIEVRGKGVMSHPHPYPLPSKGEGSESVSIIRG